jgi:DNA replication protein DnaC
MLDEFAASCDSILDRGEGTTEMIAAVRQMVTAPYGLLTIWGGPGVGKTLALQALVAESLRMGRSARYVNAHRLLQDLRNTFDKEGNEFERVWKGYTECDFLSVDELDKPSLTGWGKERIFDLIDVRYRLGKNGVAQTAFAMNTDPRKMTEYIADRLYYGVDAGIFRVVSNHDPSARRSGL